MRGPAASRGTTLVELIVTIVVVAIALAAVLGLLSAAAARSADTMVQQQAAMIAQSYLREILAKPFGTSCYPCAGGRPQMAAVGDYKGLTDLGVHDENNRAVNGLTTYTVTVVEQNSGLGTVPGAESELVTVTVTPPTGPAVILSGYRMRYP